LTEKWRRKGILRRKMLGNLLKLSKIFNLESYKTKLQAKDWKAELSTAASQELVSRITNNSGPGIGPQNY
jgi:hypothetical protein